MTKLGFTGTREGMTPAQRTTFMRVLAEWGVIELDHGDCVGSDEDAHDCAIVAAQPIRIVVHPPENPKLRAFVTGAAEMREPLPYLDRNRNIVDATDCLVATPEGFAEVSKSGTWYTVRYARKQGKPVTIIWPDGTLTTEQIA